MHDFFSEEILDWSKNDTSILIIVPDFFSNRSNSCLMFRQHSRFSPPVRMGDQTTTTRMDFVSKMGDSTVHSNDSNTIHSMQVYVYENGGYRYHLEV